MKYRCVHCQHVFELAEQEFRRCPNCFWTTSLVAAGDQPREPIRPAGRASSEKSPRLVPMARWAGIVAGITVLCGAAWWAAGNLKRVAPALSINLPGQFRVTKSESPEAEKPGLEAQKVLSPEELRELMEPMRITIPRQLGEDEEEILKKVLPSPISLKPFRPPEWWTLDGFKKLVRVEETKRKIPLGWSYRRTLTNIFKEHYLSSGQALAAGDYLEARRQLIQSLAFPIYRNDAGRYRAVVLVMLRPFINDVLGKIAVINQYLLNQNLAARGDRIYRAYQDLIAVLDLQEWEKAVASIEQLKREIARFESEMKQELIPYPLEFRNLDLELQAAVEGEATPPEGAGIQMRALVVDIGLKEKIARQNTVEALAEVEKQYERALELVRERKWEAGRDELLALEYPPELAQDAKRKAVLVDKIRARASGSSTASA